MDFTNGCPSFGSLLSSCADSEGTVDLKVSKLVSEIAGRIGSDDHKTLNSLNSIIHFLKETKFQIQASADREELLEFLN
jgi:hypothetical protein